MLALSPISRSLLLVIPALLWGGVHSSQAQDGPRTRAPGIDEPVPVARAVRLEGVIVMDGVPDEPEWMRAPAVTEFWQHIPDEGAPSSEKTEVRFLYDDENLYVGAWLHETGRILTRLRRRDASGGGGDTDIFAVSFDSYHDHTTAYRFTTNPSSYKRDMILVEDGDPRSGDVSWDPVYELKTSIGEGIWYVELRIPFSQFRYSRDEEQVWGLQIERKFRDEFEDAVWAFTSQRERGGVARYGHLVGIQGLGQGRRLELLPYVGGRAEYRTLNRAGSADFDNPFRTGHDYFGNAGLDVKYRLTSNITLDATVNPDFGQVEMDPAVINLTAFETRFDEKRPFFVEGAEIFRFGNGGTRPGPMDAQVLYARRIGRAPQGQLPSDAVYADVPGATTILGAVKLTGKTRNGWSVGLVDAVTGREAAPFAMGPGAREEVAVEPMTNYLAGRLRRDVRSGAASMGVIGTMVHRDLGDEPLRRSLRSAAYVAGVDGRVDWDDRAWRLSAQLSPSYVTGDAEAIDLTQRSSARYLGRPDADHLEYDPAATSLAGVFGRVDLSKQAGDWQGKLAVTAISPGYEINDLGFQQSADRLDVDNDVGYVQTRPGRFLRQWNARVGLPATWNLAGEAQTIGATFFGSAQLLSYHSLDWSFTRTFDAWNDRLTRGGPLTRQPGGFQGTMTVTTDARAPVQLVGTYNFARENGGSWSREGTGTVLTRFGGMFELELGPQLRRAHTEAQYVTTAADPLATHTFGRRYVFADLDETTVALTTRLNAAFTPDLSLEVYAQPFLSSGDYFGYKELAAPRTYSFREYGRELGSISRSADGHYGVDPRGDGSPLFSFADQDFDYLSLMGNAVLRWEYRPGSTIFLVWQQIRDDRRFARGLDGDARHVGSLDVQQDARALLRLKPANILLVKANFWLNP